jgi:hypothetical protein
MMTRFLLCLALLAAGVAPAHADPRHRRGEGPPGMDYPRGEREGPGMAFPRGEREGPGMGFPRGAREGRPDDAGRGGYRGDPRFEGRRGIEMDEEERPPMRRRADQDRARDQMRAGAIRPLRDIQQQWRQGMPGYDFLGSDYDPGAGSYRLKFLRDGSVLWIDVDGRTGREIGRRGR